MIDTTAATSLAKTFGSVSSPTVANVARTAARRLSDRNAMRVFLVLQIRCPHDGTMQGSNGRTEGPFPGYSQPPSGSLPHRALALADVPALQCPAFNAGLP
jgi:hypothetical protein